MKNVQDKSPSARRRNEAYRGTPIDDNEADEDLDKQNSQVIDEQFLTTRFIKYRHGLRDGGKR